MGDLLRKPWLLPAALQSLGHVIDADSNDCTPPKLIQVVEVHVNIATIILIHALQMHPSSRCAKARVSDKFNYCIAVFTKNALQQFDEYILLKLLLVVNTVVVISEVDPSSHSEGQLSSSNGFSLVHAANLPKILTVLWCL